MSNMSYCRFYNTKSDLVNCLYAIDNWDGNELSEEEARAGKRMFRMFLSFCADHYIIENYDMSEVEKMFDLLCEGKNDEEEGEEE